MNSQRARVWTLADMAAWFWEQGTSTAVRRLDWEAPEKLAGPDNAWGLDNEFPNYFDMGA
jgi:hypothetical protein